MSGAILDNTSLCRANLKSVRLQNTWLGGTDLTQACLEDIYFGEFPSLEHNEIVETIAYNGKGDWLLTTTRRTAFLWETDTGNLSYAFIHPHPKDSKELLDASAISFDGKWLVCAYRDGAIYLVDRVAKESQLILVSKYVKYVALSADNKWLAVLFEKDTENGKYANCFTVVLVDIEKKGTFHSIFESDSLIGNIIFIQGGKSLVWGSEDGKIYSYDIKQQKISTFIENKAVEIEHIAVSRDERWLAFAGIYDEESSQSYEENQHSASEESEKEKCIIEIWNIPERKLYCNFFHKTLILSIAFSPDGKTLASSRENDPTLYLWDIEERKIRATFHYAGETLDSIAFKPDENVLACCGESNRVQFWDIAGAKLYPYSKKLRNSTPNSGDISPDGKLLACIVDDMNTLELWDVASGYLRYSYQHAEGLYDVAFNPNGKQLALGSNGLVLLWDIVKQEIQCELRADDTNVHFEQKYVYSVDFSSNGKWIAAGGYDNTIRIWDSINKELYWIVEINKWEIKSINFNFNSQLLALGNGNGSVQILDVINKDATSFPILQQEKRVSNVIFSPNGKWLAAGSEEGKIVRLWDVTKSVPKLYHKFQGHSYSIDSIELPQKKSNRRR